MSFERRTRIYYSIEWGRKAGQREATGLYTVKKAKTVEQQVFNKDALIELEKRVSKRHKEINATVEFDSSIGEQNEEILKKQTSNFFLFYEAYVKENPIPSRRHLKCSFNAFKKFIGKPEIPANEVTEKVTTSFRDYLMKTYHGETPGEYFQCFKKMCQQAKKDKYFNADPSENVVATMHESSKKDILDIDEWKKVLEMPCSNPEVKKAAIFSLYTGLRWVDVSTLEWKNIKNEFLVKKQNKTQRTVDVPLHAIAKLQLGTPKSKGLVFDLPSQDGANKILGEWIRSAGVENKHITWHSLRHSLSVFLQDEGMSPQVVSGILGHKNAMQTIKTYSRYSSKQAKVAVNKLPFSSSLDAAEVKEPVKEESDIDKQLELKRMELEILNKQLELARLQAQTNPLKLVK